MHIILRLVNAACAFIASISLLYLVISSCILVFILAGTLVPGQPMYMDAKTPSLFDTMEFLLACLAVVVACIYVRFKLGKKNDLAFFQRK